MGMYLNSRVPYESYQAVAAGRQIRDKNYVLRFRGKPGERAKYTGRILAVGISYDRKTKAHFCEIEEI